MLDTAVTPELAAEGLARDVVRVVQQARRDAGLDVSDRIALVVDAPARSATAVARTPGLRRGGDAGHVGVVRPAGDGGFAGEVGDGETVRVLVTKD